MRLNVGDGCSNQGVRAFLPPSGGARLDHVLTDERSEGISPASDGGPFCHLPRLCNRIASPQSPAASSLAPGSSTAVLRSLSPVDPSVVGGSPGVESRNLTAPLMPTVRRPRHTIGTLAAFRHAAQRGRTQVRPREGKRNDASAATVAIVPQ